MSVTFCGSIVSRVYLKPNSHRCHLSSYFTPCAKNLGVLFDCNLGFEKQISAVVKSSFFHLRRLSKIKSLLSVKQFEQIIHLFVLSRLDYCNSPYYGISQSSIMHLQMVQNAAAGLMTGRRRFDHISILISLNWLPVKFRIILKILTFVFKSLQNQAPSYLSEAISTYKPNRSLRSSNLGLLCS